MSVGELPDVLRVDEIADGRYRVHHPAEDPEARAGANLMLGELGPRAARVLPAILGAFEDEAYGVREEAVKAAAAVGRSDPQVRGAVHRLRYDADRGVRRAAVESLKILDGPDRQDVG